ncbi:MAG: hypothetical protein ABR928_18605 [Terracidiphilus sp.]
MLKFKCLGIGILLFLAAAFVASQSAHAQDGKAEYCANVYTDGGGTTTIHNGCPYQIHYYWIPLDHPNMHYNRYLDAGRSDRFQANGEFRWYACDAAYYVVGPDGRVITHLVDSYSCQKK